jgi:hypothetical protein
MTWYTASALRLAAHAVAALAGLIIAFGGIAAVLIALGGTGGFTADPPPEHPLILNAVIVTAIAIALESCVLLLWRAAVRFIDSIEAR